MKSGDKTKKGMVIKRVICIVVLVLVLIDLFAANYLVSFALTRSAASGVNVAPKPVTSEDTQDKVDQAWEYISALTDKWVESAEKDVVSITSNDGLTLVGDVFRSTPGSHKWLIAVHGYTSKRQSMYPYARYYAEKGYNVITPDNRAHGESEGEMIGMGWLDKEDIKLWIDYLIDLDPDAEIVIHGVSMGAATVMMLSGDELSDNVKVLIEDCGYTSVWDEFTDEAKYLFHVPQFPILYTASLICKIRAGYFFQEASSVEQVKKTKLPMLFIHGSKDNFVDYNMVYKVYDACPTRKDIYIVEGAGHGEAMYLDPDQYFNKVFSFIVTN